MTRKWWHCGGKRGVRCVADGEVGKRHITDVSPTYGRQGKWSQFRYQVMCCSEHIYFSLLLINVSNFFPADSFISEGHATTQFNWRFCLHLQNGSKTVSLTSCL